MFEIPFTFKTTEKQTEIQSDLDPLIDGTTRTTDTNMLSEHEAIETCQTELPVSDVVVA